MTRDLTEGERVLLVQAFMSEASREQLKQINMDILGHLESAGGEEARQRLFEAGEEHEKRRKGLELLAVLAARGELIISSPLIIPEIA